MAIRGRAVIVLAVLALAAVVIALYTQSFWVPVAATAVLPFLWWVLEKLGGEVVKKGGAKILDDFRKRVAKKTKPLSEAELRLPPGVNVVPTNGLRSFDAEDSKFFMHLLPGPRRDDIPESIHFWKTRIESTDADKTFRIGVLFGPSGCGKSSLMKAGVMPALRPDTTIPVYVEAAGPRDTKRLLLAALKKQCAFLQPKGSLRQALKRKDQIPANKKIIIILDQFEQFLHGASDDELERLIKALRVCDGARLQVILMIRDDFITPTTRFLERMGFAREGDTILRFVDLFDRCHAKKVLALFGKAFGKLSEEGMLTPDHDAFLNQSIKELANEDHVSCVQLALFAQMMRSKEWTLATLKQLGGFSGIGIKFLEEQFDVQAARPEHRRHAKAARLVLESLLPERNTDIKGARAPRRQLIESSGYNRRPDEFDKLIKILDTNLHLITPATAIADIDDGSQDQEEPQYYQLTHDYLVPSLREWLDREKSETLRGRLQLRLAYRAALWKHRQEKRHLSWALEWLLILVFTKRKTWTVVEREMMVRASIWNCGVLVTLLVAFGLAAYWFGESSKTAAAESLVEQLRHADIGKVPEILEAMGKDRSRIDPLLKEKVKEAPDESSEQLHMRIALYPVDKSHQSQLYDALLTATPSEFPLLCDTLALHKGELIEDLWGVLRPIHGTGKQRLRAAAALAAFDADSQNWETVRDLVAADLVNTDAKDIAVWKYALHPVRDKLESALTAIFRDKERTEIERFLISVVMADYLSDSPNKLAETVIDADDIQFPKVFQEFTKHGQRAITLLENELDREGLEGADEDAQAKQAKRQANAAVALLQMGHSRRVWPLLKSSTNPTLRNYLIHRVGALRADANMLVKRLYEETDVTILRALILSLGECDADSIASRDTLVAWLLQSYTVGDDAGVHGAAEWLLRRWKEDGRLDVVDKHLKTESSQRIDRIQKHLLTHRPSSNPGNDARWFVNTHGKTMVVIPGPVRFRMGSPPTEVGRELGISRGKLVPEKSEALHEKSIGRTFAIATKAVTVEDFLEFSPDFDYSNVYANKPNCPINTVTWYDAVAYCNWLSEREGLESIYEANEEGKFDLGMKVKPNYLSLNGYRLPTEAEWEYACRAGALTSHYYGCGEELLGKYAWYTKVSQDRFLLGVGSLKPNDFGLFDMLGNAWQWCEDRASAERLEDDCEDQVDVEGIRNHGIRMLRGGSFTYPAWNDRCANRYTSSPTTRNNNMSFRLARTFQ